MMRRRRPPLIRFALTVVLALVLLLLPLSSLSAAKSPEASEPVVTVPVPAPPAPASGVDDNGAPATPATPASSPTPVAPSYPSTSTVPAAPAAVPASPAPPVVTQPVQRRKPVHRRKAVRRRPRRHRAAIAHPRSTATAAATSTGTRLQDFPRYEIGQHPRQAVRTAITAFVLLGLVGGGGLALAGLGGAGLGGAAGIGGVLGGDGSARRRRRDKDKSEGVVESAEIWHLQAGARELALGDRSWLWRWPLTSRLDALSVSVPAWLATRSPLLARLLDDSGYLRAMFGSASLLSVLAGVALGALAVSNVAGQAMPPSLSLTIAISVLGVIDAGAGLIAMLVFAIGTVVLGGIDSWASIRVLLGLTTIWVIVPLLAGAARPLRRPIDFTAGDLFDRLADVVIASLIGAWAVQAVIASFPGLSGYSLPIADSADTVALIVLIALVARVVVESVATEFFPQRLKMVHREREHCEAMPLQVRGLVISTAIFVLIAIAYVGSTWQLWLGLVLFVIPSLLSMYSDKMPGVPRLAGLLPRGLLKTVVMLFVCSVCGLVADNALKGSTQLLGDAFVLLSLPGLTYSILKFVAGGPEKRPMTWTGRFAGMAVLALGLFEFAVLLV
jgi:hypothetical protein